MKDLQANMNMWVSWRILFVKNVRFFKRAKFELSNIAL